MTAIEVNNLSIKFRLTHDHIRSIKEYVVALLQKKIRYEDFWALKDVSFTVEKGDVVGIIGRNGAGKSTLLKLVSEIMKPTAGTVSHVGTIVPMLELGAGFDMDLTGRENIFLNGAILGYSKEYLEQCYDKIIEFSGLEKFIDTPIRNYSSGMMARLAFSVAAMVEPEILIVDEVLSVGDGDFQKKSYARMMELMDGGTTVLLVSHSIEQIRTICNRVIWLDHGQLKMAGETQMVCDAYVAVLGE